LLLPRDPSTDGLGPPATTDGLPLLPQDTGRHQDRRRNRSMQILPQAHRRRNANPRPESHVAHAHLIPQTRNPLVKTGKKVAHADDTPRTTTAPPRNLRWGSASRELEGRLRLLRRPASARL